MNPAATGELATPTPIVDVPDSAPEGALLSLPTPPGSGGCGPDTFFAIVDDAVITGPNIRTVTFKEHEGSFLVGVAAALTSQTNHVGFVGAVPIPLIEKFQAGYEAGLEPVIA